jgi:hypothetical protein
MDKTVAEQVAEYRAQMEADVVNGLAASRAQSETDDPHFYALYETLGKSVVDVTVAIAEVRLTKSVNDEDQAKIIGSIIASMLGTAMISAESQAAGLGILMYFDQAMDAIVSGTPPAGTSMVIGGEVVRSDV